MIINLIIITLLALPNGLYKRSHETVVGYKDLESCLIDKGRVEQAYASNKYLLGIEVDCVSIEEV